MRIAIACDHGGFHLKEHIKKYLTEKGIEIVDHGTYNEDSVDYPDFAEKLCKDITSGESGAERGILICGTGIGISIAANKCKGIRAALCADVFSAKMSREHNNANVIAIGARIVGAELAKDIVKTFLTTDFSGEERHQRRIDLISGIEENFGK